MNKRNSAQKLHTECSEAHSYSLTPFSTGSLPKLLEEVLQEEDSDDTRNNKEDYESEPPVTACMSRIVDSCPTVSAIRAV